MRGSVKLWTKTIVRRSTTIVRSSIDRLHQHGEAARFIGTFSLFGVIDFVLTKLVGAQEGLSVVTMDPTLALVGFSALVAAGVVHLLYVAWTGAFVVGARNAYVVGGLVGSAMLAHTAAVHQSPLTVPACFAVGALLAGAARSVARLLSGGDDVLPSEPGVSSADAPSCPGPDPDFSAVEHALNALLDGTDSRGSEEGAAEPAPVLIDWGELDGAPVLSGSALAPAPDEAGRLRRKIAVAVAAVLLVAGVLAASLAVTPRRQSSLDLTLHLVTKASTTTAPTPPPPDLEGPPDLAACAGYLWGQGADTDQATQEIFQAADLGRFDCPAVAADRSDNLGFQWETGHRRAIVFDYVHHRVGVITAELEDAVASRHHGTFEPQQLLGDDWFEWFEHRTCDGHELWVALDRKEVPLVKAAFVRTPPEVGGDSEFALLEGTRWTWWYAEARDHGTPTPDQLDPRPVEGDVHALEMSFDGRVEQFRTDPPDGTLYPTLEALRLACA